MYVTFNNIVIAAYIVTIKLCEGKLCNLSKQASQEIDVILLMLLYLCNLHIPVDREIFVVKKVSWGAPPTKIKCTKIFLQRIIMYKVYFCVCAYCIQLPLNP